MKLISYVACLAVCSIVTQAQAGPTIKDFMKLDKGEAYFNCAYKGKTASKKCLVKHSYVKSNTHPVLKQIYGSNENLPLMTIKWPDNDTSRYVSMDSFELGNLETKELGGFSLRTTEQCLEGWCLDLSRGLIIDNATTGKEHVRLW